MSPCAGAEGARQMPYCLSRRRARRRARWRNRAAMKSRLLAGPTSGASATKSRRACGHERPSRISLERRLFSPDGARIVTASADTTARVWDAATGKPIAALAGHDDSVNRAAFSPDGARVVTASDDKTARLSARPAVTGWCTRGCRQGAGTTRQVHAQVGLWLYSYKPACRSAGR
jgi:dipeptidyl aminopeptidase/acylaminoacyl peptidase